MENTQLKDVEKPEAKPETADATQTAAPGFDPVKLFNDSSKFFKDTANTAASFLPGFELPQSKNSNSKPANTEKTAGGPGGNKAEISKDSRQAAAAEPKADAASKTEKQPDGKALPAKPANDTAKKPGPLDQLPKELKDKVIDRIDQTENPVLDIKDALHKLDNLKSASVSINGRTSHIEIDLMSGKTVAPPNVSQRGFRPVASHIDSHISFDMTAKNGGMQLSNMEGFSSTVRGPLGRLRHSETNSMFIGRDRCGPYVQTQSDLHMRRRIHSSTTTLRENQFPADSPVRSAMNHPDALQKVSSMLRMFQDTHDTNKLGLNRDKAGINVFSEAGSKNHVELDFKPEGVALPVTVKSLDLDKKLSATLSQNKDSVSLEKIDGLNVNIEIGGLKMTLAPSKVTVEKDQVKLELKHPETGESMPIAIPVSKLKEAARKAR